MGLADAYLVLRAAKKIATLAVDEAASDVAYYMRTSSVFGSHIPRATETKQADEAADNTVPHDRGAVHVGRSHPRLSSLGVRNVPIALHPGSLDRKHLLRTIRPHREAAPQQQQQQQQCPSKIHIPTANLSHICVHVPPPLILLRGEQLQISSSSSSSSADWLEAPAPDPRSFESSDEPRAELKASSMPSNRVSRLFHYGSLAVGLGFGALGEATRRLGGLGSAPSDGGSSVFLTRSNIDRMVSKLTRMRGAALKLGQMLSIQDSKSISPEISEVLQRVQSAANYVPMSQVEKTMRRELGQQWRQGFSEFSETPFAAASIGQVHEAQLDAAGQQRHGFGRVAVKVQYPGVASSIDSDLDNLQSLLVMSKLLPRGMYLENTIKVARKELHWECDYVREADAMTRFGSLLAADPVFVVPRLVPELSSKMVLTAEFVDGVHMRRAEAFSQDVRDYIGTAIMRLCLQELFEFEFMQTDPNWANFLYNTQTRKIALLDFGASRSFDKSFLDKYLHTLRAAMEGDREACRHWSTELGFLTGYEADVMTQAHVDSVLELGKPFASPGIYDFGRQDVTENVRSAIPVMLRHRLTPPPDETYSLHRKLSGAILLCIRLGANVPCQALFKEITSRYTFSDGSRVLYA
ncbi:hypothetical protein GGI07_003330 [Coemansia sp. Benny D115]|nr:hypothetical protein GGI07_003330 [Coemansia sp. Benny D115]